MASFFLWLPQFVPSLFGKLNSCAADGLSLVKVAGANDAEILVWRTCEAA